MPADENFLSRWSRRKTQARVAAREEPPPAAALPVPAPLPAKAEPADSPLPAPAGRAALPAVESLTTESDFSPFMAPEVDGDVRRKALKTLFSDPRFNAMDMMDVYVDDYSKPDPIPADWMDKLEQVSRLGDRAGRDRLEAERKARAAAAEVQAEAEAPAAVEDGAPVPPPQIAPPPGSAGTAAQEGIGGEIPVRKAGESGT